MLMYIMCVMFSTCLAAGWSSYKFPLLLLLFIWVNHCGSCIKTPGTNLKGMCKLGLKEWNLQLKSFSHPRCCWRHCLKPQPTRWWSRWCCPVFPPERKPRHHLEGTPGEKEKTEWNIYFTVWQGDILTFTNIDRVKWKTGRHLLLFIFRLQLCWSNY